MKPSCPFLMLPVLCKPSNGTFLQESTGGCCPPPTLCPFPPRQPLPQELLFEMLGTGTSAIGALLQKDASSLITGLISSQRPPGTDGYSGKIWIRRGRRPDSSIWDSISSPFVYRLYVLLWHCPCYHAGGSGSCSACLFLLHCWIHCSWTLSSCWLLINYCLLFALNYFLLTTFNYLLPSYLDATSS